MQNFNLKKFLTENKLTTNSRLIKEAYLSPEGNLEDFSGISSSGNLKFDKAFEKLLQLASKGSGNGPDVVDGLKYVGELAYDYFTKLDDSETSITDVIEPTSEFNLALINTLRVTGENLAKALEMVNHRAHELLKMYQPDTESSSKSFFSSQDLNKAKNEGDQEYLKYMQDYNKKEAEANNTVKDGIVIWDFYKKKTRSFQAFRELLEQALEKGSKKLYYYYCEPGESIGVLQISPQEALATVGGQFNSVVKLPSRLPGGYEYTIYAV